MEELAKVLRSITLSIGEEEATGLAWVLRVPSAARQLLTLCTARHGIGDGNLIRGGRRTAPSVIDLVNALIAVGAVNNIAAATGGVDCGGGLDGSDGLTDGVGCGRGCGGGGGDGRGRGYCGASWGGKGGGGRCRGGSGLRDLLAACDPLTQCAW